MVNGFHYYMHDGPSAFCIELAGELCGRPVQELDEVPRVALSHVDGRSLIVDLSSVTEAEDDARAALRNLYDQGAQLVATRSPASGIVEAITGQVRPGSAKASRGWTWRPIRLGWISAMILAVLLPPSQSYAADLRPETVAAWEQHLKNVNERHQKHFSGDPFILSSADSNDAARLRKGEILISPAGPHALIEVPSGLIHDWIGAAFVPNVTLADVMNVVRDYGEYKKVYAPHVVDARIQQIGAGRDRFSLVIMNKSFFTKTALDIDFHTTFTCLDSSHCISVSEAARIREISDYGGASSRTLPENQGSGMIWRLYSVTWFEEADSGVYIELEAIALSRDIPGALRWMVEPIIRRVSRSAMETSLKQTAAAAEDRAKNGSSVSTGSLPIIDGSIHSFR